MRVRDITRVIVSDHQNGHTLNDFLTFNSLYDLIVCGFTWPTGYGN